MPLIIGVHGVGQQYKGKHTLQREWLPSLLDGLSRVNERLSDNDDLACAFYGDLFRRKGTKAHSDPLYDATDVEDEWEKALLLAWWRHAGKIELHVPGPDYESKLRTPRIVQRALNALSNSRFFEGIAERSLIGDLKQVYSYIHSESIFAKVQERVANEVSNDTKVILGHSLGSVVAYEALCSHPDWPIETLITLGSPLGIHDLIFDRLRPPPVNGVGVWPKSLKRWINIADGGDVVALEKQLRVRFGDRVEDHLIYNGVSAHDIRPYLTAEETGRAIAFGLAD